MPFSHQPYPNTPRSRLFLSSSVMKNRKKKLKVFSSATTIFHASQDFNLDQHFLLLENCGEGSYGEVTKRTFLQTGETVAIKRIKVDVEDQEQGFPNNVTRECSNLLLAQHPCIVELKHTIFRRHPFEIFLVFEYVDSDLSKYLKVNKEITPVNVKRILYQIVKGVKYLHDNETIHRDLKPGNILMKTETLDVKIADFGFSRSTVEQFEKGENKYTLEVATLWYKAPEILLGGTEYDSAVDVWALGVLITQMLMPSRKPIFQGECQIEQLFKIFKALGTPSENMFCPEAYPAYTKRFPQFRSPSLDVLLQGVLDPLARGLVTETLRMNPKKRAKMEWIVNHRYFDEVRREYCGI